MAVSHTTWTGSLHQTFRILTEPSANMRPFLESHGRTPDDVLDALPYDRARALSRGSSATRPDPKRYRDGRQVYQTAGLLYESQAGRVVVTELGQATHRWLDIIKPANCMILARHAAYALSACQLRNPTGAGSRFDDSMEVFPFAFIWRAMLNLDGKIASDELNRAIFRVKNEDDLHVAIENIRRFRTTGDPAAMGAEVVTDAKAKNDRIIPWMSIASFGWTLFPDKRGGDGGDYYEIPDRSWAVLREAASIHRRHRIHSSQDEYVNYVSDCAALPKDLR